MRIFLKKITIFILLLFGFFELFIRFNHLTPDVPRRVIENGIQKYIPNQNGFFNDHVSWATNEHGWPGISEINNDTIIAIIGDSFIENFHNPDKCHQAKILKENFPNFAFFEAARSGMTFIEELEVNLHLQKDIKPLISLIYISENDLFESIKEINEFEDRTQLSLEENRIIQGKIKSKRIKYLLYNIKVLHYLYLNQKKRKFQPSKKEHPVNMGQRLQYLDAMLDFIQSNYNLNSTVVVFHPDTDSSIINLFIENDIVSFHLESQLYDTWKFTGDSHWNCIGHSIAADQVTALLERLIEENRKGMFLSGS